MMDMKTLESGENNSFLSVAQVEKRFDGQVALNGIKLDIRQGEFFTLLGPSGCGKSTLLRIIAGFERPDGGSVSIRGRAITDIPPENRPVNMVFQSYALFPHLSVAENVAYGPRAAGDPDSGVAKKVRAMLSVVQMQDHAGKSVVTLSGGQQQRVALARALVNEPSVLLLDEPLGALDLQLRRRLQEELRTIQRTLGTTFVYVTHDQEEAMALSDRIAVMDSGVVMQVDEPQVLYERPVSRFVAEFVGTANVIPCKVRGGTKGHVEAEFAGGGSAILASALREPVPEGKQAYAVARPEQLLAADPARAMFHGRVRDVRFIGSHFRYDVELDGETALRVASGDELGWKLGDEVGVRLRTGHGVAVEAR